MIKPHNEPAVKPMRTRIREEKKFPPRTPFAAREKNSRTTSVKGGKKKLLGARWRRAKVSHRLSRIRTGNTPDKKLDLFIVHRYRKERPGVGAIPYVAQSLDIVNCFLYHSGIDIRTEFYSLH